MVRHGVRRLVVVRAARSPASSRSTTSPRAGSSPSCRRGLRAPRCRTTSSTLAAADDRLGERPDHRVRAGAVAGQLGLEERAEEERVAGQLERARRAVVVVGAEDDAGVLERLEVRRVDAVGAVVALDGAVDAGDPLRSACRACSGSAPSWPTQRALERHDHVGRRGVAVLGVVGVARCPPGRGRVRGSRAGSRRTCRGTGSRARARSGRRRSTFSRSRVRAAGDDPDAVEAVEVVGLGRGDPVRVEHEAVAAAQRVDQQRDAPVGADGGERSPTRASLAVMDRDRRGVARVHVQR